MRTLFAVFSFFVAISIAWGQGSEKYYEPPTGNNTENQGQVALPNGKSFEAKLFREALMRGRQNKEYYVLVNDEKKVIRPETLVEFCKANGYLWDKNYKRKEVSKFGDKASSVYKFWFIPKTVLSQYVFEWTNRDMKIGSDLRSKGSVYFYDPEANSFLHLANNALWTGSIADGHIDGFGSGIWQKDDRFFYYFSGTFHRGFPVGKAKYRIVDTDVNEWGYSPKEKMPSGKMGNGAPFREVEVGEMKEGIATFRYLDDGGVKTGSPSELYGYVNQNGTIIVNPSYKEVSTFQSGRAVVKNNKDEIFYIDKKGQFIDYTAEYKEKRKEEERKRMEEEIQRELARYYEEEKRNNRIKQQEAQRKQTPTYSSTNSKSSVKSRTCSDCNGQGYISCYSCDGSGGHYELYEVFDEESGFYDAGEEWVSCSSCSGEGRFKCSHCGGKGKR